MSPANTVRIDRSLKARAAGEVPPSEEVAGHAFKKANAQPKPKTKQAHGKKDYSKDVRPRDEATYGTPATKKRLLATPCPKCSAKAGQWCREPAGTRCAHSQRIEAAGVTGNAWPSPRARKLALAGTEVKPKPRSKAHADDRAIATS